MIPTLRHFVIDQPHEEAKALFKASVHSISLSISSYCNRQCSYCPNSIADRKSHRNFMSDDLFFSIMRQLTSVGYDGRIHLHRYNEPLADKDYALSRIRDVRVFLPKAEISIYTNGDYLDRPYFDELARLGVYSIAATVHAGAAGKTDFASVNAELDRRIDELGLAFKTFEEGPGFRVVTGTHSRGTHITYNAHDFLRGSEKGNAWALDRGGVLDIPKTYVRTRPCFVQFLEMEIEWDGKLLPCCQIHNDAFSHDDYVLGTLTPDTDLFRAWTNANYVDWRIKMSADERKDKPCTTCSYGMIYADGDDTNAHLQHARALLLQLNAKRRDAALAPGA